MKIKKLLLGMLLNLFNNTIFCMEQNNNNHLAYQTDCINNFLAYQTKAFSSLLNQKEECKDLVEKLANFLMTFAHFLRNDLKLTDNDDLLKKFLNSLINEVKIKSNNFALDTLKRKIRSATHGDRNKNTMTAEQKDVFRILSGLFDDKTTEQYTFDNKGQRQYALVKPVFDYNLYDETIGINQLKLQQQNQNYQNQLQQQIYQLQQQNQNYQNQLQQQNQHYQNQLNQLQQEDLKNKNIIADLKKKFNNGQEESVKYQYQIYELKNQINKLKQDTENLKFKLNELSKILQDTKDIHAQQMEILENEISFFKQQQENGKKILSNLDDIICTLNNYVKHNQVTYSNLFGKNNKDNAFIKATNKLFLNQLQETNTNYQSILKEIDSIKKSTFENYNKSFQNKSFQNVEFKEFPTTFQNERFKKLPTHFQNDNI